MKTLTPCIYCLIFFEDLEGSQVCEECTPKLFIDMALQSIEEAVNDLRNAIDVDKEHILKRKNQIELLNSRFTSLIPAAKRK